MSGIDWVIVGVYLFGTVAIGFYLMLRQRSAEDYYMGGRRVPAWLIASSIVATQSSAVSLLGGPAFVAARKGGGLLWLQYELAVPLAMAALIPLMISLRRSGVISIYEYIETRVDAGSRFVVSVLFQLSRILATGVSLYATAILFSLLLNVPLFESILLLGGVALLYTMLGGIMADIISDFIQLIVLFGGVVVAAVVLLHTYGPDLLGIVPADRWQTLDFGGIGLGDGRAYGFWPMLIGGFFLYMSYYGCDQSQAQRLLTGPDEATTARSLLLNGILRFPLVLTYVFFGLLLAGFIQTVHPPWLAEVASAPDRLVPLFIRDYFPAGARGLFMAAIIAAAMSSFDSAYNSVSAATFRDLVRMGWFPERWQGCLPEVWFSRGLTLLWGGFSMGFAIWVSRWRQTTVIELINMVGSMLYGPIFAAFFMARFMRGLKGGAVIPGLVAGLGVNLYVARAYPGVSWLWWNVIGFGVTLGIAVLLAWARGPRPGWSWAEGEHRYGRSVVVLVGYFMLILGILFMLHLRHNA